MCEKNQNSGAPWTCKDYWIKWTPWGLRVAPDRLMFHMVVMLWIVAFFYIGVLGIRLLAHFMGYLDFYSSVEQLLYYVAGASGLLIIIRAFVWGYNLDKPDEEEEHEH